MADQEQHESEYECPGCGQYLNGFGTLSHHTERCQKALLVAEPETCERCGGWGWIDADPEFSGDCPDCNATGKTPQSGA